VRLRLRRIIQQRAGVKANFAISHHDCALAESSSLAASAATITGSERIVWVQKEVSRGVSEIFRPKCDLNHCRSRSTEGDHRDRCLQHPRGQFGDSVKGCIFRRIQKLVPV